MSDHRQTRDRDEGSLILAVLLALMVTSLVLTMAVGILAGQDKTRTARDFATGQQAADAAVNDAIYWFHQYSPVPPVADRLVALTALVNSGNRRTGTVGEINWSWYTTPSVPNQVAYPILVEVTGRNVDRNFRVTLAPTFGAPVGFTAYSEGIFRGRNIIKSYDDTNRAEVGTNGKLTFSTTTTVGGTVTLWNSAGFPHPGRCSGTACSTAVSQVAPIGDLAAPAGYQAACTAPPRAWIASVAAAGAPTAVLAPVPGGACYSSMLFDRTTTITGTTANPVQLYVTGDITVRSGVRLNVPLSGTPDSRALQVYSRGETVTLVGSSSLTGASRIGWTLSAASADCLGIPAAGQAPAAITWDALFMYGSMSCDTITSPGGWQLLYDRFDTPRYKLPLWAALDYVAVSG